MKTVIATALSLSLLVSGTALAAPPAGPQQRPQAGPAVAHKAPGASHASAPVVRPSAPAANRPAATVQRPATTAPVVQRHRAHRKGERLQAQHRGVRVTDLRGKGLRAPARGQEWRLLEGRYLLVSTATGLIIDIITAHR